MLSFDLAQVERQCPNTALASILDVTAAQLCRSAVTMNLTDMTLLRTDLTATLQRAYCAARLNPQQWMRQPVLHSLTLTARCTDGGSHW